MGQLLVMISRFLLGAVLRSGSSISGRVKREQKIELNEGERLGNMREVKRQGENGTGWVKVSEKLQKTNKNKRNANTRRCQ